MSFMETLDKFGLVTEAELSALEANQVRSFGDLLLASEKEPRVFKPVLDHYIKWFNKTVAPRAVVIATGR